MPIPQPMSPGVYIDEIKSAVHTITGVATSVAAFIGRALKGPVDTPTSIDSLGAYQRTFGALSMTSPMGFAVRDFFLNGGSQALIVRVANGAGTAGINLTAGSDNLQLVGS